MKKWILFALTGCLSASACQSLKRNEGSERQQKTITAQAGLVGTWELFFLPDSEGAMEALYPHVRPSITFEPAIKKFQGTTGCNHFNGSLVADSSSISFQGTIAMTRKACRGSGEEIFLKYLSKIDHYSIGNQGKELVFHQGDAVLMRFEKK